MHLPAQDTVALADRVWRGLDSFAAEIAALEAVLRATAARGAERLCVFIDCVARLALARATAAQMAGDSYTEQ